LLPPINGPKLTTKLYSLLPPINGPSLQLSCTLYFHR
jgi:hypothetical protein